MAKNRIKELRNSANPKITLKELSEKLKEKGLSFTDSQLSKFENGTSTPRNEDIWGALAEIFNASLGYVMGVTDEKDRFREDEFLSHVPLAGEDKKKYPHGLPISFSRLEEHQHKAFISELQKTMLNNSIFLSDENIETIVKLSALMSQDNIKGDLQNFFDVTLENDNFSSLRTVFEEGDEDS
ncbi:helix-turn-helix domain-containing protein [Lactococcus lactis]|uniref:helix-turn-helix domain-containing protein n=1 Tax=Lactococcus lactis TaxID=1358 RepID=UPI000A6F760D|nr:helix-turn-helix transcriptional regulator [Lactococcus lactis]